MFVASCNISYIRIYKRHRMFPSSHIFIRLIPPICTTVIRIIGKSYPQSGEVVIRQYSNVRNLTDLENLMYVLNVILFLHHNYRQQMCTLTSILSELAPSNRSLGPSTQGRGERGSAEPPFKNKLSLWRKNKANPKHSFFLYFFYFFFVCMYVVYTKEQPLVQIFKIFNICVGAYEVIYMWLHQLF